MLTDQDRQLHAETGLIPPDRMDALQFALHALADDARAAAADKQFTDSHLAAALRGRALAYREAARMVQHITEGRALHPRRFSSTRRRNREWALRRSERKAERLAGGAQ